MAKHVLSHLMCRLPSVASRTFSASLLSQRTSSSSWTRRGSPNILARRSRRSSSTANAVTAIVTRTRRGRLLRRPCEPNVSVGRLITQDQERNSKREPTHAYEQTTSAHKYKPMLTHPRPREIPRQAQLETPMKKWHVCRGTVGDPHASSQQTLGAGSTGGQVMDIASQTLDTTKMWPLQGGICTCHESSAGQFAQIAPLRIGGHAWDPTYLSGNSLHWHSIGDRMHAERYIEMQRGYLFDEHLVVCEYSMYCIV